MKLVLIITLLAVVLLAGCVSLRPKLYKGPQGQWHVQVDISKKDKPCPKN